MNVSGWRGHGRCSSHNLRDTALSSGRTRLSQSHDDRSAQSLYLLVSKSVFAPQTERDQQGTSGVLDMLFITVCYSPAGTKHHKTVIFGYILVVTSGDQNSI